MSLTRARQTLVTAVEAARAAYSLPVVIQYDNRYAVETANQFEPWLAVDIQVLDSYQGDLSYKPLHRHIGIILLQVHTKRGEGTAQSLSMLDHFISHLQRRQFDHVRTQLADARPTGERAGWYINRAAIPFWFDVVADIAAPIAPAIPGP